MFRMARLYLLLFAVQILLAIAALISCMSADEGAINALPRIAWVLIILFFPLLGSIAWFAAGRSSTRPAATWRPGAGFPERERPRPVAPDDDPTFLRSIRDERARDEDMFAKWEEDLRRREEQIRKERPDGTPEPT
jgi:hypothetical protein